jgi:rSAM/selenodomain-associated transferase 2
MRLSVIIPTFNEAEHTARAIDSAQDCGAAEVIVVDGGSSDDTPSIAQRQGARVLHAARGRAAQQNAGASHAQGDHLLFLHADNWLDRACGQQIRSAMAAGGFGVAAFRQHIEASGWTYRLIERGNAVRIRWLRLPYGDQAILIRRELFERVGGFPDVKLLEDVMLMRKVRTISRPMLLPGPVHVSPRRWQTRGPLRQTLRNWTLLAAWRIGAKPETLARYYQPHASWDQNQEELEG